MITEHDHRKKRCPRLGNEVPFSYCREPASKNPCPKIGDCWWETFDIAAFMREHYGEPREQPGPQSKAHSLWDILQAAQKRVSDS